MPELPEVESFRYRFERDIQHRVIQDVLVLDQKVLRKTPVQHLKNELIGKSFISTFRQGKYFFAELSSKHWLHIHLGMTGEMENFEPHEDAPKFSRIILEFAHGPHMAYVDMRKFGSFFPIPDLDQYISAKSLGPDALTISEAEFLERLSSRKGILKAILLQQSVLAGLGNLYVDEICLQTRIHPASRTEQIPGNKLKALYQVMMEILTASIDRHAEASTYPSSGLWSWREKGYYFKDGRGPVESLTLAGRTTYVVPDQKVY